MTPRVCCKCKDGIRLEYHPHCAECEIIDEMAPCPMSEPIREPVSNCADCGREMTKSEGGTVFTVCDECWDKNPTSRNSLPIGETETLAELQEQTEARVAELRSREPEREQSVPNSDTAIHEANRLVRIADRCPKCGSQSLFIGSGGWITCSWIECKEPGLTSNFHAHQQALREAQARIKTLEDSLIAERDAVRLFGMITEAQTAAIAWLKVGFAYPEAVWTDSAHKAAMADLTAQLAERDAEIARLKEAAKVDQAHIDEADDLITQHYARAIKAEARAQGLEARVRELEADVTDWTQTCREAQRFHKVASERAERLQAEVERLKKGKGGEGVI